MEALGPLPSQGSQGSKSPQELANSRIISRGEGGLAPCRRPQSLRGALSISDENRGSEREQDLFKVAQLRSSWSASFPHLLFICPLIHSPNTYSVLGGDRMENMKDLSVLGRAGWEGMKRR